MGQKIIAKSESKVRLTLFVNYTKCTTIIGKIVF